LHRRAFIALLAVGAAKPGGVAAQPAARVYPLGILAPTAPPAASDSAATTRSIPRYLEGFGCVPGRTLVVEHRYAAGRLEDLPAMARDLIRIQVEAIVAIGSSSVRAAKAARSVIPVVMFGNFDPVAIGLVKSLAKPEANVTGVLIAPAGTLAAKKLELLKEAVSRATRVAFLTHEDPGLRPQEKETQAAAAALGVTLLLTQVRGNDYEQAFVAMVADRPHALFVAASTYFVRDRKRIIELAARHRLPAMYE
jgi:putative ABC transport system substrate-binding protein